MTHSFSKVFCIGFNKTGTSSMHRLFTELGLRSFHGYYSHIPVTDPLYREFDCFSDGDQHDYALLDRTFPGSRFIITTRRLDGTDAAGVRGRSPARRPHLGAAPAELPPACSRLFRRAPRDAGVRSREEVRAEVEDALRGLALPPDQGAAIFP